MSTLDLQREGLLWQHVALLTFYSSPEWKNQKLALERAFVFCNFSDPCSEMRGVHLFAIWNHTANAIKSNMPDH